MSTLTKKGQGIWKFIFQIQRHNFGPKFILYKTIISYNFFYVPPKKLKELQSSLSTNEGQTTRKMLYEIYVLIYKIVYEIYFSDLPLVKIFYSAFCLEVDDNNNIKSCSFIYQHLLIDIYFISLFAAKS